MKASRTATGKQLARRLDKTVKAVGRLATPSSTASRGRLLTNPYYVQALLARPLEAQAWAGLERLAAQTSAQCERQLKLADRVAINIVETKQDSAEVLDDLKQAWKPLDKRPGWPALREALESESLRRDPDGSRSLVDLVQQMSPTLLTRNIQDILEDSTVELDRRLVLAVASSMGATLARGVARFNREFAVQAGRKTAVRDVPKRYSQQLTDAREEIWRLLSGGDLAAAGTTAQKYETHLEASFLDAATRAAAVAARRRSAGRSIKDGPLALRIAEFIRDSLVALALCRRIRSAALLPPNSPLGDRWLEAARGLILEAASDEAPQAPIDALIHDPSQFDGTRIAVEGVVGPIQRIDDGKKPIYAISVSDAISRSALVVTKQALAVTCVSSGAYARFEGTWHAPSSGKRPARVLELAESVVTNPPDWLEWTQLELRTVFSAGVSDIITSWEPGLDGPGNPIRFSTWFIPEGG